MVLSMLHQLGLGPVWKPQEVDVLGKGREFPAASLESLFSLIHDKTNSEIAPHSPNESISRTLNRKSKIDNRYMMQGIPK